MRDSRQSPSRPFRRHAGLALAFVGAIAASVLAGAVPAAAGGPTSVLVASPQSHVTASAYTSDTEYATLARAVDESPDAEAGAPDPVIGPGGTQINVTWLMHDVWVWRVDRIVLDVEGGPWIYTQVEVDEPIDFDKPGVWHRSPTPEELVALLERWGMTKEAPAKVEPLPVAGDDSSRSDTGLADAAESAAAAPAAGDAGVRMDWWLAVPLLALGLTGGALAQPALARLRAWVARTRDPAQRGRSAQELIDA